MKQAILLIVLLFVLAGCYATGSPEGTQEPLPAGDAARGEALFTTSVDGAPTCSTCHTLDGSKLVGPSLQGFGEVAGTRVEGQTAEDYIHESIVRPSAHIVESYSNVMYANYGVKLDAQQLADLIAFLLTQ